MSTLLLIFQHSSKVNYCTGFIIRSERQEGGGRWGGEGQGAGGSKNYGVECLGGRIDEGYSIGEPRVHLRKGGHYSGW